MPNASFWMEVPMKAETLKSGFMDKGLFYRTDEGTQQGGVISPTLMLMTLTVVVKLNWPRFYSLASIFSLTHLVPNRHYADAA
ncbi:hypothetical protein [Psychrosphaera algicola]|uniref:Reverse transcriptase domain-containing protein n=1 Tax=Psychrosphaera algicola TaxID=3023714 RepID=A0ABT5FFU7_9GAMM|nr:hypothetical protein [Psychrosphaera sp. G1-22]MDC2889753.1 hypothetical protein [Psychrosphaera sp. G1-22]